MRLAPQTRRCTALGLKRCSCARKVQCSAIEASEIQQSLSVLKVQQLSSLVELRQAYYERIRDAHPDVNMEADTTAAASEINAAYAILREVRTAGLLRVPQTAPHT